MSLEPFQVDLLAELPPSPKRDRRRLARAGGHAVQSTGSLPRHRRRQKRGRRAARKLEDMLFAGHRDVVEAKVLESVGVSPKMTSDSSTEHFPPSSSAISPTSQILDGGIGGQSGFVAPMASLASLESVDRRGDALDEAEKSFGSSMRSDGPSIVLHMPRVSMSREKKRERELEKALKPQGPPPPPQFASQGVRSSTSTHDESSKSGVGGISSRKGTPTYRLAALEPPSDWDTQLGALSGRDSDAGHAHASSASSSSSPTSTGAVVYEHGEFKRMKGGGRRVMKEEEKRKKKEKAAERKRGRIESKISEVDEEIDEGVEESGIGGLSVVLSEASEFGRVKKERSRLDAPKESAFTATRAREEALQKEVVALRRERERLSLALRKANERLRKHDRVQGHVGTELEEVKKRERDAEAKLSDAKAEVLVWREAAMAHAAQTARLLRAVRCLARELPVDPKAEKIARALGAPPPPTAAPEELVSTGAAGAPSPKELEWEKSAGSTAALVGTGVTPGAPGEEGVKAVAAFRDACLVLAAENTAWADRLGKAEANAAKAKRQQRSAMLRAEATARALDAKTRALQRAETVIEAVQLQRKAALEAWAWREAGGPTASALVLWSEAEDLKAQAKKAEAKGKKEAEEDEVEKKDAAGRVAEEGSGDVVRVESGDDMWSVSTDSSLGGIGASHPVLLSLLTAANTKDHLSAKEEAALAAAAGHRIPDTVQRLAKLGKERRLHAAEHRVHRVERALQRAGVETAKASRVLQALRRAERRTRLGSVVPRRKSMEDGEDDDEEDGEGGGSSSEEEDATHDEAWAQTVEECAESLATELDAHAHGLASESALLAKGTKKGLEGSGAMGNAAAMIAAANLQNRLARAKGSASHRRAEELVAHAIDNDRKAHVEDSLLRLGGDSLDRKKVRGPGLAQLASGIEGNMEDDMEGGKSWEKMNDDEKRRAEAVLVEAEMEGYREIIRREIVSEEPRKFWEIIQRMRRIFAAVPRVAAAEGTAAMSSEIARQVCAIVNSERGAIFFFDSEREELWAAGLPPSEQSQQKGLMRQPSLRSIGERRPTSPSSLSPQMSSSSSSSSSTPPGPLLARAPSMGANPEEAGSGGGKEVRFPASRGIAGWVATHLEPCLVPDAYADHRFNTAVDAKSGFKTRNILAVPILHPKTKKLIAVLQAVNHRGSQPFSAIDNVMLGILGSQLSAAITPKQTKQHVDDRSAAALRILTSTTNLERPFLPLVLRSPLPLPSPSSSSASSVPTLTPPRAALAWIERAEHAAATALGAAVVRLFVVQGAHSGGSGSVHDETGEMDEFGAGGGGEGKRGDGVLWWMEQPPADVGTSRSPFVKALVALTGSEHEAHELIDDSPWRWSIPRGRIKSTPNHARMSLAGRTAGRLHPGAQVIKHPTSSTWYNSTVDITHPTPLISTPCLDSTGRVVAVLQAAVANPEPKVVTLAEMLAAQLAIHIDYALAIDTTATEEKGGSR